MAASSKTITFIVNGESQGKEASEGTSGFLASQLKQSVQLRVQRGDGNQVRLEAEPGADVVVLHIANGPTLILHPDHARDLFLAQAGTSSRSRGTLPDDALPHEVAVSAQLQWRGLESKVPTRGTSRGFLGDAVLSCIEVFKGPVQNAAADFTVDKVIQKVDGQVTEGVYKLSSEALPALKLNSKIEEFTSTAANHPVLVLIHGTFSSTSGTFGTLWIEHPQHVRSLFSHYKDQVYALDHATLGRSPVSNALTLARSLPKRTRLHLLTHSRGGLVAEILAYVCGAAQQTEADLSKFTADERVDLLELSRLVKQKQIAIERVVRVGCPARGTLLASKRLDAYLSVFKWALELAQIPVLPELVDFLNAVAQRRADPDKIPGLAAQIPDSPLIQWLHSSSVVIPGQLRVIAGDMEGDSVTSWLKTMLADAFYWEDNDLVVQTSSMYGGSPREAGATFFLHQDGKVSHFKYFSNQQTAGAVINALTNETPAGFRTIGPLSWAGKSPTGVRAKRGPETGNPAQKPAVFLLPGILGSNLKVDGKRVWLDFGLINGFAKLAYKQDTVDRIEPDGPISLSYDELTDHLSRSHQVIEFAYDWRRPIEEEAQRLGAAVEAALEAREKTGQPVRILAHSMGGLVARTMQLECPQLWSRMMSRPGARMLMLGTPNAGSWAPMQCLSGDDTFSNMLVAVGAPFKGDETRQLMAGFPGFIQLQAGLLDGNSELARESKWKQLADADYESMKAQSIWHREVLQLSPYKWGVPSQGVLDQAVELRRRLDDQANSDFGSYRDKLLLVIGESDFTPDGFREETEGLVYLNTQGQGDGRVTHHSAQQLGVKTWIIDCEHGKLPDDERAFAAYEELLEKGFTNRLKEVPFTRGQPAASQMPSRPSRQRVRSKPPESERDILRTSSELTPVQAAKAAGMPLQISIINGDLMFITQPLMLGHYSSTRLTGTESVMNKLTGGLMEKSLAAGLYPDAAGEHQLFANIGINPHYPLHNVARPESVIVVGLGEEGKLRPGELTMSVRQAVISCAQRMAEDKSVRTTFQLAATLIGSGGSGISAGKSALLIAQGVREANERLKDIEWPRVDHLYLVELYLDRASEAWRALQMQVTATPGHLMLTGNVLPGMGALRRPLDSGYRGANYDFIAVHTEQQRGNNATITYALDTRRARAEVTAQQSQRPLLQELITSASNSENNDPHIGHTLFKLLVPIEVEPFLSGTTEMVIEVDAGTAGIPWELLDSGSEGGGNNVPWAICSRLIRKLRTDDFRRHVSDANTEARVLIIGEPACDVKCYAPLPGAQREATAVSKRLLDQGGLKNNMVCALIENTDAAKGPMQSKPEARAIINALLSQDWRIIHIAGHGEPPELPTVDCAGQFPTHELDPRGVVLSNGTFLGPREINSMRVVPELVFVNCCHLAKVDPGKLFVGRTYNRAQFAASVAEELIKIGVRCVVAAGWAVEDSPAAVFAGAFYNSLLQGQRFMDAVTEARVAARGEGGNTWAAYQCYGDPDWVFKREAPDAQRPEPFPADEFSGVASAQSLILTLQTLEVRSNFQDASADKQRGKIRYLEAHFSSNWGKQGDVAEAFALAWAATHDTRHALQWYERAVSAPDGSASIKATEQLYNFKIRLAWEAVDATRALHQNLQQSSIEKNANKQKVVSAAVLKRKLAAATGALNKEIAAARNIITGAASQLEILMSLQPSLERAGLCGSAYKRLALVETVAGRTLAVKSAIRKMKSHYDEASKIGVATRHADVYYPQMNSLCADIVINAHQTSWKGLNPDLLRSVKSGLQGKITNDPDFWSAVGSVELKVYEAIAQRKLASAVSDIEVAYEDVRARISAPWKWASVYDEMSLVLPAYAVAAKSSERQAAELLLEKLRSIALSDKAVETI